VGSLSAIWAQVVQKEGRVPSQREGGGQRAAGDAQTGQLREPTAADTNALTSAMNKQYGRSTAGITFKYLKDGTVMARLPESYSEVLVVKINPDGSRSQECVAGIKNAEASILAWDRARAPQAKRAGPTSKAKLTRKAARKDVVR
jgi:hypothetical protein